MSALLILDYPRKVVELLMKLALIVKGFSPSHDGVAGYLRTKKSQKI
jgi:hypothetical protein